MPDIEQPIDFRDMLHEPIGNWTESPIPPVGHFRGVITRMESGKSAVKHTTYFCWPVQLKEPMSDVKPVEMEGVKLEDWEVGQPGRIDANNFWWTPRNKYVLRNFLESLGCPTTTPADEFILENEMLRGMPVIVGIAHETEALSQNDLNSGRVPRVFLRVDSITGTVTN